MCVLYLALLQGSLQCILSHVIADKIKVDSWWRWLFWHCSYCLCKCDEITESSERYWSLLPALADVDAGKAWISITGRDVGAKSVALLMYIACIIVIAIAYLIFLPYSLSSM